MMNKKQRPLIFLGVLVVLAALMLAIYFGTRPAAVEGDKNITVTVVHRDESTKTFRYNTSLERLGDVLRAEDLIQGEDGPYGYYVTAVDGESAVYEADGAYWALYQGEEYSVTGVDETLVVDGAEFSLVYTVG